MEPGKGMLDSSPALRAGEQPKSPRPLQTVPFVVLIDDLQSGLGTRPKQRRWREDAAVAWRVVSHPSGAEASRCPGVAVGYPEHEGTPWAEEFSHAGQCSTGFGEVLQDVLQ